MIRSFLPIGQGAFYCECFDEYWDNQNLNIIYDCGSSTNRDLTEQQIQYRFEKGVVIDALFISHLDADHINGIPFLLKYCNVKKIFFPLISHNNRELMKIYFLSNNIGEFTLDFLENPYQAINSLGLENNPQLIEIEEKEGENFYEINTKRIRSGENVLNDITNITSNGESDSFEWLFIPFNFRHEEQLKQLLANLKHEFRRDITANELSNIWTIDKSGDRARVKEAYKNIKGDFNTNSMTLFSGEILSRFHQQVLNRYIECQCIKCRRYRCRKYDKYNVSKPSGCLYMGDYNALGKFKWNDLKQAYIDYWKYIGCIQIPHHGSRHNFNIEFSKMDVFHVISAGFASRYKHPHITVIKALLKEKHIPYIVTEESRSIVCFEIH